MKVTERCYCWRNGVKLCSVCRKRGRKVDSEPKLDAGAKDSAEALRPNEQEKSQ